MLNTLRKIKQVIKILTTSNQGGNMFANINAAKLQEAIEQNTEMVILDVRTKSEFNDGFIPNAINIDVQQPDFIKAVNALDKSKDYYVYCRSGARSAFACNQMAGLGFSKLNNLSGGIMGWHGAIAR